MIQPKKLLLALLILPAVATAELELLVEKSTLAAISGEVSGVSAKRNLDTITLYHRTRASTQYNKAASHILSQLLEYGFDNARIIKYPADGKTMFGTQKSRPGWNVEFAELWEVDTDGHRIKRHASWEAMPLSLAQDSVSGSAHTTLIDIGPGTRESDYAGKDIKGSLVLTSSQPGSVQEKAVGELGASGIVSYAPNQKTAWWKEDDRLVRWGHLGSFNDRGTFAFMVSLRTANTWKSRMRAGETIMLDAQVRASQSNGQYWLVTAVINGESNDEIIYSCHLDHPRPGANDNASGCVSILETARTLKALIDRGTLSKPKRSLRFVWPAEIEGSIIYLSELDKTSHIKANIHLDMVGGGSGTKSVFRISGGPMSRSDFMSDVAHEIGYWVNEQTLAFASGDPTDFPLVSAEGSKNPQLAVMEGISMGSDHQVFNEGTWAIPGIYLHDWPDRYIHTNFDTAAMIDPTKLKRAAFIAAVQGWYLADFGETDVLAVTRLLQANALKRAGQNLQAVEKLEPVNRIPVMVVFRDVERMKLASIEAFSPIQPELKASSLDGYDQIALLTTPALTPAVGSVTNDRIYQRNPKINGPMTAFGYSYLQDKLTPDQYQELSLKGAVAYEALNLVDGSRTISEIQHWLMAEFGPVSLESVEQYLLTLKNLQIVY